MVPAIKINAKGPGCLAMAGILQEKIEKITVRAQELILAQHFAPTEGWVEVQVVLIFVQGADQASIAADLAQRVQVGANLQEAGWQVVGGNGGSQQVGEQTTGRRRRLRIASIPARKSCVACCAARGAHLLAVDADALDLDIVNLRAHSLRGGGTGRRVRVHGAHPIGHRACACPPPTQRQAAGGRLCGASPRARTSKSPDRLIEAATSTDTATLLPCLSAQLMLAHTR